MNTELKFYFLGTPQIFIGDKNIAERLTPKALALVSYLAVNERMYTRDTLATFLWQEATDQQARNNLRYLLPELREHIGAYVTITHQAIGFNQSMPYWLDVLALRHGLATPLTSVSPAARQAVLDLYRGELLEGFHVRNTPAFEEWVTLQRQALHDLVIQDLLALAGLYQHQGLYGAGLKATYRLLTLAPWSEAAHRQQMQLLMLNGQRAAALAQFAACRQILADEFSTTPEAQTVALYEAIRSGHFVSGVQHAVMPPTAPSIAEVVPLQGAPKLALFPKRGYLPRPTTPLIGRQEEIAQLSKKLQDPYAALITLYGEGGSGKTRLALAAAEASEASFPDGVWFVPLRDLMPNADHAEPLAAVIGQALQLPLVRAQPLKQQLYRLLYHCQTLLILDGFEQFMAEKMFILDLLQQTRAMKVLVTTRERLNFQAEFLFRLEGLPVPEGTAVGKAQPNKLLTCASVALFVERAQRHHPGFHIGQDNQIAISRICQWAQGLPLAIELAATLVAEDSCNQIADWLPNNYRLLATTLDDIPAHHRSIQVVLDASWSSLPHAAARLLACCSIFHGSFTAEAACEIVGATVTLLMTLQQQAFLHQPQPGRLLMHTLVRQYASEQLASFPVNSQELQARYSEYYATFLQTQSASKLGVVSGQQAIQAELDNISAAWGWACQQKAWGILRRCLKPLAQFYRTAGLFRVAEQVFAQAAAKVALEDSLSTPLSPEQGWVWGYLRLEQAAIYVTLDKPTKAVALAQQAIKIGEQMADPAMQAEGYLCLADMAWARVDYPAYQAALAQGLALAQKAGLTTLAARCWLGLGKAAFIYGNHEDALIYFRRARKMVQPAHDLVVENQIFNNLSIFYGATGNFSSALYYAQRTLITSHALGGPMPLGYALLNLGTLRQALGNFAKAKRYFTRAHQLFQKIGHTRLASEALRNLAGLAVQARQWQAALRYCQRLLDPTGYSTAQVLVIAGAYTYLGRALTGLGQWEEAQQAYAQATSLWQTVAEAEPQRVNAQAGLAALALAQQDLVKARAFVEQFLPSFRTLAFDLATEPFFIYLTACQVLAATHDREVDGVLRQAYELLQEQATKLPAQSQQEVFLNQVPVNHELLLLAQAKGYAT